ncbi:MAG: SLC13 family permease [Opitutales bacterium]
MSATPESQEKMVQHATPPARSRRRLADRKALVRVAVILTLAVGAAFLPIAGLTLAARVMLGIFVLAAGLWVTETIPPFATAILVVVSQIYLLGQKGGPLQLEEGGESYEIFLNPLASPVLVLFFGGFILSLAAQKTKLDQRLAKTFLTPFGTRPANLMLGVILVTGVFSMFMSNTATTLMMVAIVMPLFNSLDREDPFKKALILSVPFAANIGGLGTLIGSPPNAVAASVLGSMGHPVTFTQWMLFGFPLALVLLFVLWLLMRLLFKPRHARVELPELLLPPVDRNFIIVVGTFAATVGLWMLEPLHGIPSAVAALLPIMIFTMFGIIGADDLKRIEWDVLILVAGGLSLGVGLDRSGLSDTLVGLIPFSAIDKTLLLALFAVLTVLISNFMSNTSAANMLIPIVAAIPVFSPLEGPVTVALCASLAMSLPISTPPNAIVYATRSIATADMARTGSIVSVCGVGFLLACLLILF